MVAVRIADDLRVRRLQFRKVFPRSAQLWRQDGQPRLLAVDGKLVVMQRISGLDRLPTRLLDIGAQSLEPLGHWHCRRVGRRLQVPHCGRMLRQGGRIRHLSDLLQGGLDLGKCPFDLGEVQTGAALRVGCITALIDSSNPVLVGQFHT